MRKLAAPRVVVLRGVAGLLAPDGGPASTPVRRALLAVLVAAALAISLVVSVEATDYGTATVGASNQTARSDRSESAKITLPAGTVTSLSGYIALSSGSATTFKFALYADSGGVPAGASLVSGTSASQNCSQCWVTITVADTNVAAGDYWLAMIASTDGNYNFRFQTGGGTYRHCNDSYAGFPPSSPPITANCATYGNALSAYVSVNLPTATPTATSTETPLPATNTATATGTATPSPTTTTTNTPTAAATATPCASCTPTGTPTVNGWTNETVNEVRQGVQVIALLAGIATSAAVASLIALITLFFKR